MFWLESLERAKNKGARIIVDYTDHHLGLNSPMSEFYKNVFGLADSIVTSSQFLKFKVCDLFTGPVFFIPDPIEVPIYRPKQAATINTMLWFGHSTNIIYLIKWLEALPVSSSFNLIGLTNSKGYEVFSSHKFTIKPRIKVIFYDWSIKNMLTAAKISNFCIIPSDLNDIRKLGASSNRLLTAFALGLPTAATRIPSYQEFSEFFVDLESNPLLLGLNDLEELTNAVSKAQANVLPCYSMSYISKKWGELLASSG